MDAPLQPQTYLQTHDGNTCFVAELPVPTGHGARALPKINGLPGDGSGSGANRRHDLELAVLDYYLKAVGNPEVRLARLRDRPEPIQSFTVTKGDWSSLRAALQATVYDGASVLADC